MKRYILDVEIHHSIKLFQLVNALSTKSLPSQIRKRHVLFLRLHTLLTMSENDADVSVILVFCTKNVIKLIQVIYYVNYD